MSHTQVNLIGQIGQVVGFAPTWPAPVLVLQGPQMLRRADYGGLGRVRGTVAIKGTPDAPVRRIVRLIREIDGVCVAQTISDAVTGEWEFAGFDPAQRYTVLAYDVAGGFTAAVASGILPSDDSISLVLGAGIYTPPVEPPFVPQQQETYPGGRGLFIPPTRIPASLEPLRVSDSPRLAQDELEADLKAAMIEVFEAMLRPGLLRLNSYGVPHRGTFPTVERFVKADGLAMERKTAAEAFMAELYRAWRARNPRRGTAFLRYYLQLLWPNQWTLVQQWQDSALPYPTSLHDTYAPGRFLTSRLRLTLALAGDDSGELVSKLSGSFRAVLPARMLLDVALTAPAEGNSMRVANWGEDCEWEDFEGVAATA